MTLLTCKLIGINDGPCDFADFASFTDDLAESLRRIHRAKTKTGKVPHYEIIRLEVGSALLTLADSTSNHDVLGDFVNLIGDIRQRVVPRLQLSSNDFRFFRRLANPLASRTSMIEIENVPIDDRFSSGCDWLIDHAPKSFGQLIGRLEGLNIHNKKSFRIYPEGTDRGAECFFPDDLYKAIVEAIGKRIRVEGLIHRDPDGVGIDQVTKVKSVTVVPEDSDLPALSSLIGLFRGNPVSVASGWDE